MGKDIKKSCRYIYKYPIMPKATKIINLSPYESNSKHSPPSPLTFFFPKLLPEWTKLHQVQICQYHFILCLAKDMSHSSKPVKFNSQMRLSLTGNLEYQNISVINLKIYISCFCFFIRSFSLTLFN